MAGARAESSDKIDPAAIRFITPTASTSTCIGKPTTPMCGIETLIGCAGYIWNKACEAINKRVYPHVRKNVRIEYVIVKAGFANRDRVRAVHEKDEADGLDLGHFPWLTEDAFQAIFFQRTCPASAESCEGAPWRHSLYTVSPHGTIPDFWSFSMAGIFVEEYWFVD